MPTPELDIQVKVGPFAHHGATAFPIYQTATFEQERPDRFGQYDYSRSGNPTRSALEQDLASLDRGTHSIATSSGCSALAVVFGLVEAGGRILAAQDLYGGTLRLLGTVLPRGGIHSDFGDPALDPVGFVAKVTPATKLIHFETPSNPLLKITDIRLIRKLVNERAAKLGCEPPLISVDATMATPLVLRPLELGAHIVIHSATKYLGGHGDVTAGAITVADAELAKRLGFITNAEGVALGPFDCFLLHRGLKTLGVRFARQQHTALSIAEHLERRGKFDAVLYAGLPSLPGYQTHARQANAEAQSSYRGIGSGIISLRLGSAERAKRFAHALRLIPITVSFGSIGSTLCYPAGMSHASVPEHLRPHALPPDDLVRVSIGLEEPGDLLDDIQHAAGVA